MTVVTTNLAPSAGGAELARRLLRALQGLPLATLTGQPNTILDVDDARDEVLVATERSPDGRRVPVADVEAALRRLLIDGEVRVTPKEIGYRSAFLGAFLRTLPGTETRLRPARVIMAGTSGQDDDATAHALLAAIAGLRQWRRGSQQAPHKPLLLVVALDRVRRGLPRLVAFSELEERVRPLLDAFVGRRTEVSYPFWRLQTDGLWEIPDAALLPPRVANTDPPARTLRERATKGGLPAVYDDLLRRRPDVLQTALQAVLEHLPRERHQELLDAVGWIGPATVPPAPEQSQPPAGSAPAERSSSSARDPSGAPGIFISYRRTDSEAWAGRLYDHLARHYGRQRVFMDVDDIQPGQDFIDVVNAALDECAVLLVVIGPRWLGATDARGQRRLEDPDDIVRMEIIGARDRNLRIIPLLVGEADMPGHDELPLDIAFLRRRNGMPVRHGTFRPDTERLLTALDHILAPRAQAQAGRRRVAGTDIGIVAGGDIHLAGENVAGRDLRIDRSG